MVPAERLESLRQKHSALSRKIESEYKRPYADDNHLRALKRQKLFIKDIMDGVREQDNKASKDTVSAV